MGHRMSLFAAALTLATAGPALADAHNVLLIIADDVGAEKVSSYADDLGHDNATTTPNIDALALDGVRFTQAWSNPTCSPTRAGLNTGRHAIRHGIGAAITTDDPVLDLAEQTFADLMPGAAALLGKWHLGAEPEQGGLDAPRQAGGYARHAGGMNGAVENYALWRKATDGVQSWVTAYPTFDTTDEATAWITAHADDAEPWVAVVAFNAPHTPFHHPDDPNGSPDCITSVTGDGDLACYREMLGVVDDKVGALRDHLAAEGLDDETTVIFVGDNGSAPQVVEAPYQPTKAKGTVYQGGVHVPFIVAGPGVDQPGRASDALVHTVDLFATVLEATGNGAALASISSQTDIDAVSVLPYVTDASQAPQRTALYTDGFTDGDPNNGQAAMRDDRYKLVRQYTEDAGGLSYTESFYDLDTRAPNGDPEASDLLRRRRLTAAQSAALATLRAELDAMRASAGL